MKNIHIQDGFKGGNKKYNVWPKYNVCPVFVLNYALSYWMLERVFHFIIIYLVKVVFPNVHFFIPDTHLNKNSAFSEYFL